MDNYKKANDQTTVMKPAALLVNEFIAKGYTENFKVTVQGLYAPSREVYYQAPDIMVLNFFRFEGESDPADNAILYIIETNDGVKGLLLDAYGPYADKQVAAFFDQIEKVNKKTD